MGSKILSSSMEDYLEAIYHIVQEKSAARAKDISERLRVNRSSVTSALHSLSKSKLINYTPYDIITLTPKGEKVAKKIIHRHTVLRDFFVNVLGVDAKGSEESACRMEHSVSELILERLEQFIQFLKKCPRAGIQWVDEFGYFCKKPETLESCERCISQCLQAMKERTKGNGKVSH